MSNDQHVRAVDRQLSKQELSTTPNPKETPMTSWIGKQAKTGLALALALAALGGGRYAQAATFSLTDNRDFNAGPLLANWSSQNNAFSGPSLDLWEDTSAAFVNNSVTYTNGVGLRDSPWAGPAGYNEWWLGGQYTTFTGTARIDSPRTGTNANALVTLVGDGVTLATSSTLGMNGTFSFNNVDVSGVELLQLRVKSADGWGGRPQHFLFWSQADVTSVAKMKLYSYDILTAGTSSREGWSLNAITFGTAYNQAGGAGTTPSINSWQDTTLPLVVGGQTVQGVGFRAPAFGSYGSVTWTLSPGNTYELFTFDLARDDRMTGSHTESLQLIVDGITVGSFAYGSTPVTYSVALAGAAEVTFRMNGSTWGGASPAYLDIINPRFIMAIPEPTSAALLALAGLGLWRRPRR